MKAQVLRVRMINGNGQRPRVSAWIRGTNWRIYPNPTASSLRRVTRLSNKNHTTGHASYLGPEMSVMSLLIDRTLA